MTAKGNNNNIIANYNKIYNLLNKNERISLRTVCAVCDCNDKMA